MSRIKLMIIAFAVAWSATAYPDVAPSAPEIVAHVLDSDPWGLSGANIRAHAGMTDKQGARSELTFVARSKRYDGSLAKSVVRISAPPELAGAAFLQIQKRDGDDDRYLFLPDLKRSRRISGNLRSNAFMGTDFSFADLDRRDLRDSDSRLLGEETIGRWACYTLDVVPKRADAQYAHIQVSVRKDNWLPLRMKLYDKGGVLSKTFEALEVKRVEGRWFISRSKLRDEQHAHATELVLDDIQVGSDPSDDDFTVRALEKP